MDIIEHARDLAESGDYDGAYRITAKSLKNEPDNVGWMSLLSYLMLETEKPEIAYQICQRITSLAPREPGGWMNLGMACRDMRRDKEALRFFKRGLKLSKNNEQQAMLCVNIASVYVDTGEFKKGQEYCEKALSFNPESSKAVMNLGFCQLGQRNWKKGWSNYRAIIGHDWRPRYQYNDEPLWDGKGAGTIVLYGEQGLGDQISFASMLPDMIEWAKKNDSHIIIDTVPRLVSLFKRSFPDLEVYGTMGESQVSWDISRVDYSIPLGQVAEYFRTEDKDFTGLPYLQADADRVLQWKALFESKEKPVIGIGWSSGIYRTGSKFRRVDLETLKPVLESIDAHWVSLQYKPASREIDKFKKDNPHIDIVEYPFGTLSGDYDDTVAMIAAMDMVLAMHTTACHVAGGLGVPCWTIVPKNSQWRYGQGYEDFLWADSIKLIRQKETGKWGDVINKLAKELPNEFGAREAA